MKIRYIKYWAFAAVLGMGTVSCEDFLNPSYRRQL